MNVYQFIDGMIERLNNMTVKGIENCNAVVQTVNDLQQLKQAIVVRDDEHDNTGNNVNA